MYYDLNVPWNEESQQRIPQLIKLYQKFGYGAVAFNHTVTAKLPKTKCPVQKIKGLNEEGKQGIRQYTRLTMILDNPQQNYGINSTNEIIKSYDLIAIQPTTEKMFQVACSTLEIDLITFDFSSSSSSKSAFFPIKHGFVRQALDRGIFFEIIYAGSILDPTRRRQAILTAQTICRVTKGKNVIFTSGADNEWILRAPADAMNLAGVFGIPAHQRKQSIQDTQRKLMEHAASRKLTYRTAVATIPEDVYNGTKEADNDLQEDFIKF